MLEKLLVISSKKEAFNWLLLIVVDADLDTDDDVNAETDLMEVLRNAATEQRKTMAVLPKIMIVCEFFCLFCYVLEDIELC